MGFRLTSETRVAACEKGLKGKWKSADGKILRPERAHFQRRVTLALGNSVRALRVSKINEAKLAIRA
jgi:hypothetical protein